ncbi:MAG: hypothetical protein HOI59_06670 [Nitrospina sp.]|jgi:hypothetical protein|nr:hypothetical protein [Nitrospina sp.]MBT3414246.1 hypothetical protein [Nitrospina sp.]MBT3856766.1 hypothetical protein [Nitrospina sp.]MBT4104791.1 hypothetical protein [Nitrospina sp.]MBT4389174.1 hypothetical protein [Nitrospina sp.]
MLSAPIDRNKEPEPEKQVSRINSPYWTLPTNGGLGSPQNVRPSHSSEGIILRVRDTRMVERRENLSPPESLERRTRDNRKKDSRWNNVSHHVLVIAIERQAGEPEPWKTGDRVSVIPKTRTAAPVDTPHPPTDTGEDKPPLLTKDEGDYVLHLSKPYPAER